MIGRFPRNLGERLVKLEAGWNSASGSDLFVIWGKNDADLKRKVGEARAVGDLKPGDRYSARIWPRSSEMPPSRHTSLFAIFLSNRNERELEAWLEAKGYRATDESNASIPSACEFSNEQLCEILASGLQRAD
jgi:hypothetical protein